MNPRPQPLNASTAQLPPRSFTPHPHGTFCKCGSGKAAEQFFCDRCTAKLPPMMISQIKASTSNAGYRGLMRRAVQLIGLPPSRNARRKRLYA